MLKKCGYQVRPVSGGRRALESAARNKPDLILLDIAMPEMDGYEVCLRLKQDPELKQVPIVFISEFSRLSGRIKVYEVSGADFVKKPFQLEKLRARADAHLELYRLHMRLQEQVKRQVTEILASRKDRFWLWLLIFISVTAFLIFSFIFVTKSQETYALIEYQNGYYLGRIQELLKLKAEKPNNSNMVDPTYQQVAGFIGSTDCTQVGVGSKIRCQIASDCLMEAAASKGFKSHLAVINDYKYKHTSHALVVFNTSDRGIVYVEPQYMKSVELREGDFYPYVEKLYVSEVVVFP